MSVKNLIGRVDLVAGGTYDFVLPQPLKGTLPNPLDNQVIEEVYIICNTAGAVVINLPSTTLFNNAWNAKIYITTLGTGSVRVNAFPGTANPLIAADTLNGAAFYTLGGQYETIYLHIVNNYFWIKLVCPAPAP